MKRITIPMGPQHPSLNEPGCFTITLEGEKVVNAVVGVGYNHRGLEKACEARTYLQDLYLIERVCGICSHTHSTAFCQGLEELAGIQIPFRAAYIRVLMAELERLHSHLLWLGVAAHEIGFDTLFMYTWRDREQVLDALAMLGGSRVNYGINTPGGVRRDIDAGESEEIHSMLNKLEEQTKYYLQLVMSESTLAARLSGIGKLSTADAFRFGAVGPVARASNLSTDVRVIDPYAAYKEMPFAIVTDTHCDVYGRAVVRIKEILESIALIRYALDNLSDGPLAVEFPRKLPVGEVLSRTEAPRGEDMHYIRSNGTDKPDRVHIRAATEANWHCMKHMLEGDYLADVPIIIAAIDPCYSCTDRAIVLRDSEQEQCWDWQQLRQYSIAHYKKQGFDPAKIQIAERKFIL